jgi:hypothetical protein
MRPLLFMLGFAACSFSPGQQQSNPGDGPLPIDTRDDILIDTPLAIDAKVFLDAPPDAPFDPEAQCPAEYAIALNDVVSTSRYRLIAASLDWPLHQTDCADDLVGATHLVVFEEVLEAQQLGALVAVPGTFLVGYFQELNQATVGAGWHTLTGDDVAGNSTIWAVGQPNDDGGGENNAQNRGFVGGGSPLIQDGPASFDAPAVCECDGKPIPAAIAAML